MNSSNESKNLQLLQEADLIWSKLFSKGEEDRTKQDELNLIESVLIRAA